MFTSQTLNPTYNYTHGVRNHWVKGLGIRITTRKLSGMSVACWCKLWASGELRENRSAASSVRPKVSPPENYTEYVKL